MKIISFTHNDGFIPGGVLRPSGATTLSSTRRGFTLRVVRGEAMPATEGSKIPLTEVMLMGLLKRHPMSSSSV